MNAYLGGIQIHLPEAVRTNEDLAAANPGWDAAKIYAKTGIRSRHIAAPGETAADLACVAAGKLLEECAIRLEAIDVLLFCTQSPDYFMPPSACVIQERLGLPTTCAALDYNLGCSGFTYGLWLSRSLILSGSARNVLLLTGDTYTRYCDVHDLTTATIFGDGAAASLITASPDEAIATIGETVTGTDGRGKDNLIVKSGCCRLPESDNPRDRCLYMNGPEVFSFTLTTVHQGIRQLLDRIGMSPDQIDWYLFHQANAFMLEKLGQAMQLDPARMPIDMEDLGNTVGTTLPILIRRQMDRGAFRPGQHCILAGFGIGYSWGMTHLRWGTA
jgi:3-oxoacyl-[acyl-carrier-protein] synthase-3